MSLHNSTKPNGTLAEPRRCALVVVVEAETPRRAWQAVAAALGLSAEAAGPAECIYVGVPQQGIPSYAEEFETEQIGMKLSLPDGPARSIALSVQLEAWE
jgi:N-methylhydantoinase B/oxoprolinase/acetone carboxylase alpha subunit